MGDIFYVLLIVTFFAASWGLARVCDRVGGKEAGR